MRFKGPTLEVWIPASYALRQGPDRGAKSEEKICSGLKG